MISNVATSRRTGRIRAARGFAILAAAGLALTGPRPAAAQTAAQPPAQTASPSGPQSFAGVVRRVKPAVVSVRVKVSDTEGEDMRSQQPDGPEQKPPFYRLPPFDRFFRDFGGGGNAPGGPPGSVPGGGLPGGNVPAARPRPHLSLAQGSGFFISPDGYAVTNSHVVSDSQQVEVQTDDDQTYKARVVGRDQKTDVALLKVDGRNDFPFVAFADGAPQIGDWVLAVGNPYGLGGSVTAGIISARGRDIGASAYDDFLQIDAPVNKGNSGGPAFDEAGRVVGVTTAIFSPSGGSVGIGFAIPADTVKSVVAQLRETGAVTRGWIGVQIQPVTADIAASLGLNKAQGALVDEPQPDGPALRAGIRAGDVIQSVNGTDVKDPRDLAKKIAAIPPGQTAQVGIFRDGRQQTVALHITRMPEQTSLEGKPGTRQGRTGAPLGLTLAPAAAVSGEGTPGVVVTEVDPDGPAAEQGIHAGDFILEVSGRPVSDPADVRAALDGARSGGKPSVLMRVKSGETARYVAMPLAAG